MDFETSNCYFLKESRARDGAAHQRLKLTETAKNIFYSVAFAAGSMR